MGGTISNFVPDGKEIKRPRRIQARMNHKAKKLLSGKELQITTDTEIFIGNVFGGMLPGEDKIYWVVQKAGRVVEKVYLDQIQSVQNVQEIKEILEIDAGKLTS